MAGVFVNKRWSCHLPTLLSLLLFGASATFAQGTSFTYQGRLTDGGMPANGSYDLQFTLWDAPIGGTQQPQPSPVTVTRSGVAVNGGIFTVQLDFSVNAFPGADRFLEIGVRVAGSGNPFTVLAPRQQISSTPYAIRTLSAGNADALSSACSACVQDSQINSVSGSKVNGTIPVASVPGGSGNYIQNNSLPVFQAANFSISGFGHVGLGLSVDALSSNSGAVNPGLNLGGGGEGIVSKRTSGGNQFGLDFYTNSASRMSITNSGNVGIGTSNPDGVQVNASVSETARGVNNVRLGINNGTPRAIFEAAGSATQWEIDNSNGTFRVFTPGVPRLTMNTGVLNVGTNTLAMDLVVWGGISVGSLAGPGSQQLCLNFTFLAPCSSSIRYKTNISTFGVGLNLVRRLRPVTFRWKENGQADLGLIAEEVNSIEPSLVTHNAKGQIEGVKYDKLTVVLINSIKEQQAQIAKQQQQIDQLTRQVRRLRGVNRGRRNRH